VFRGNSRVEIAQMFAFKKHCDMHAFPNFRLVLT
jgi:hypothetical protein